MSRGRALVAAAAAFTTVLPGLAHACAVCGQGTGLNRTAFFVTTIVLSLLPLGLLGAGLWWLARNARGWLRSEFRESDEAAPAPEPPRS